MPELFEFSGEIKHETDSATLFDIDGEEYWVPKSLLTPEGGDRHCVPEWFAVQEGIA